MVRPLPEASALLWCEVADFALAEKLLAELVHLPVRPVAVELFAGRQREGDPPLGPLAEGNVARLCVGFEGLSVEVEWMLAKLGEEWTKLAATAPVTLPKLEDDKVWRSIAEFPVDETDQRATEQAGRDGCRALEEFAGLCDSSPRRQRHSSRFTTRWNRLSSRGVHAARNRRRRSDPSRDPRHAGDQRTV